MNVIEGHLSASGRRFGIVASRFNELVVARLIEGAVDGLKRMGASEDDLVLVRTPGAWELPLALRDLGRSQRFDALIALGAVIRGGTPHFEYVAGGLSSGIMKVSLEIDVPITFGVLTCDTLEQALDRAGAKGGNKGFEAAAAAVEASDLRARLAARSSARTALEATVSR
ncbi:MAG: 6,7-dimethyl-8-ribityllumazine synthase [Thermoanaerobaculia bacterium]